MTRTLRLLFKVVLWTLTTTFIVALYIVAINAFDEEIALEATALLKMPVNPYPAEQNLYLALLGFDAPTGMSSPRNCTTMRATASWSRSPGTTVTARRRTPAAAR